MNEHLRVVRTKANKEKFPGAESSNLCGLVR